MVADWFGFHNVFVISALLPGIVALCWIPVCSQAGVIVIAALWGFVSGPFVSLAPAVMASITLDKSSLGIRAGVSNFFNAITNLIGTPIAGAIQGKNSNWLGLQVFTGVNMLATSAFVFALRVSVAGWKIRQRM